MTRPDIEGIRARLEAATEGEWRKESNPSGKILNEHGRAVLVAPLGTSLLDAEFAVAAHNEDIPALLAYVEELEAKINARPLE